VVSHTRAAGEANRYAAICVKQAFAEMPTKISYWQGGIK
jgi:hypothetical protein